MNVDKTSLDIFYEITGYDIQSYFNDYIDFINDGYPNIVGYYTEGIELNSDVVTNLTNLYNNSLDVKNIFYNYRDQLSLSIIYWNLLDVFEDTFNKIQTIKNSQKWFRSSKGFVFDNYVEKDYILKQNQTLRSLAEELGYDNSDDNWTNIALRNDITEEDYTSDGGVVLKIVFRNNLDYRINSVIDSLSGDLIYGKDLPTTLEYDEDDEDLTVLTAKETINQAFRILVNLYKGSNPEFPQDGIDKSIISSNINVFRYPSLFRQLSNLFAKDDTFKEFYISDINQYKDRINIVLQAKTRIDETLGETLIVAQ